MSLPFDNKVEDRAINYWYMYIKHLENITYTVINNKIKYVKQKLINAYPFKPFSIRSLWRLSKQSVSTWYKHWKQEYCTVQTFCFQSPKLLQWKCRPSNYRYQTVCEKKTLEKCKLDKNYLQNCLRKYKELCHRDKFNIYTLNIILW